MVSGSCDARFERVRVEFERNFADRGEVGASVCVTLDGEIVVDLIGGVADPRTGAAWTPTTLVTVWSCSKGALAASIHHLASSGEIALDAPLARYWPAFDRAGKRAVTVAAALNHQAGLPGFRAPLPAHEVYDFDAVAERLAGEPTQWEPGTRHGYHSFTAGWLLGGVIRNVTGLLPGDYFADQLARPLSLDFWIGLPQREHSRVARSLRDASPAPDALAPFYAALRREAPVQRSVINSWGAFDDPANDDSPAALTAQVPAANGVTNARGLALLYLPLSTGSRLASVSLSRDSRRRLAAVESASSVDAVTLVPSRFSSGFQKRVGPTRWASVRIPEEAFGHNGMGGSLGFADPLRRLSFGYAMNFHAAPGDHARQESLVTAVYQSLEIDELL